MLKLSCKSCGAKLELTDDIDRFACAHCGSEWLVNRSGGIVSLKAVEESIKKIEASSDKTAEHTEILANEVRTKKIREKIAKLEFERQLIELNPKMKNPEYDEAKAKYNEHNRNIDSQGRWGKVAVSSIVSTTLISLPLIFWEPLKRLISEFRGINSSSVMGPVKMDGTLIIVIFFITLLTCFTVSIGIFQPPKFEPFRVPKHIIDKEKKEKNILESKKIENKVRDLRIKLREIESKI